MTTTHDLFARRLDGTLAAIESLRAMLPKIVGIAEALHERLQRGGTIYTCGNGGSADQAMHLAEELIGRYRGNRAPLRAVCLNTDPTALTCIANDFGFDQVFVRQCDALLREGDALVVFSTSGNSSNLVRALETARDRGALTIGLLGRDGGRCAAMCTHAAIVNSPDSAHVQEAHQAILHMLCERLEAG
jgi:D-sedoheptulose 7-phosphate isomerase